MMTITLTINWGPLRPINMPQASFVANTGQAPSINWGTPPELHINWGRPPWDRRGYEAPSATIDTSKATTPSLDMTGAKPPDINWGSPQEMLEAMAAAILSTDITIDITFS